VSSLEDLYDGYLRAASTADDTERIRQLREVVLEDFQLASPFPYIATGITDVSEKLGAVAASMPDGQLRLRRTSSVDAHNGFFRVAYENHDASGLQTSTGLHIVETRDGKIARIIVFVPAELLAPVP
jgi:hypothetical protein